MAEHRTEVVAKRSKSEIEILDLLQRYEAVCAIVGRLNTPKATDFVGITSQSLTQMRGMLRASPRQVSLSAVVAGLRQGLRELPTVLQPVLAEVSPADREMALPIINGSVTASSDFLKEQADRVSEIMRAGAIRNDDEWYRLRWRLDRIEGRCASQEEIALLCKLLDAYESPAR